MFDKLWTAIKANEGDITDMKNVIEQIEQLVGYVGDNFKKDGNLKDAIIDSVVEILQAHKGA